MCERGDGLKNLALLDLSIAFLLTFFVKKYARTTSTSLLLSLSFLYILAMLVLGIVSRVRTRSIAVDRHRRHAAAVDGRYARVTAAMRSLLTVCPLAISQKQHAPISSNFMYVSPVVVVMAQSISVLCISGFVDDVMFLYNGVNGPERKTTCTFCRVRQVTPPWPKLLSTIPG